MIEAYIACVAGTYAAYFAAHALKRNPVHTYKVWTTWHPKVHHAKGWVDAHEWADAYRHVECQVFINGQRVR